MNGEKNRYSDARNERGTGHEKISRGLAHKLGGLANRLVAGAKDAIADAQDDISGIALKANQKEEHERVIKDCGFYDREKYSLMGREGEREIEDASYINERDGVFGVFDGAGGVGEPGSGGIASKVARESFRKQVESKKVASPGDLADFLKLASRDVAKRTEGITTATVAKIVNEGGQKFLYFAQVGDSRLYIIHRGGKHSKGWTEQVTRDEGERNMVANWLGREDEPPRRDKGGNLIVDTRQNVSQIGRVPVNDGDKIVICSDGITGDVNRTMEDGRNELMGPEELGEIVNRAGHVQMAARALVEQARKKDDRSAIVVEV